MAMYAPHSNVSDTHVTQCKLHRFFNRLVKGHLWVEIYLSLQIRAQQDKTIEKTRPQPQCDPLRIMDVTQTYIHYW